MNVLVSMHFSVSCYRYDDSDDEDILRYNISLNYLK